MSSRELKLVFEDQWLVVVEKPAGLLSISTGRGREKETTAYSILKEHFGELFIVHRLDRDTSGLIVFAKDHDTKLALQENWYEAVLERKYVAILEGRIEDEEGWIETWLFEHPKSMKVHCYALRKGDNPDNPPQKDWHYASTHCRTLKHGQIDGENYTLVEFELETGRKNQIRAHTADMGHPICGDVKYGNGDDPLHRLCLHAYVLCFYHPVTGQPMEFSTPIPTSFRSLFK